MKKSEVFRQAAQQLEKRNAGAYSCCEVWGQVYDAPMLEIYAYTDRYQALFAPAPEELLPDYEELGAFWLDGAFANEAEAHEWRILALCFMAAIYEEEGE